MELLAILVGNDGPRCGASVGRNDHASIVEAAHDSCACRCGFGERDAAGVQGEVAVVVAKIEAGHRGSCDHSIRGSGCDGTCCSKGCGLNWKLSWEYLTDRLVDVVALVALRELQ